ncbi:MAG: helix-turn-helix transcriptional regulator [Acidimicrobiales bacterium]
MNELSAREQEVLSLLCMGYRNKDIAEALYISTETVKSHLKAIFRKFGVSSRCEVISLRLRSGAPVDA